MSGVHLSLCGSLKRCSKKKIPPQSLQVFGCKNRPQFINFQRLKEKGPLKGATFQSHVDLLQAGMAVTCSAFQDLRVRGLGLGD